MKKLIGFVIALLSGISAAVYVSQATKNKRKAKANHAKAVKAVANARAVRKHYQEKQKIENEKEVLDEMVEDDPLAAIDAVVADNNSRLPDH